MPGLVLTANGVYLSVCRCSVLYYVPCYVHAKHAMDHALVLHRPWFSWWICQNGNSAPTNVQTPEPQGDAALRYPPPRLTARGGPDRGGLRGQRTVASTPLSLPLVSGPVVHPLFLPFALALLWPQSACFQTRAGAIALLRLLFRRRLKRCCEDGALRVDRFPSTPILVERIVGKKWKLLR